MISDVDIERVLRFGRGVFPVHGIVDGRCTCGAPDCEHPGKHPYTPHGFKDAVFTVADFRRLCNGHANLNIAMPTEGLIVPDVDQHRGGDDTWHQLVTELGIADAVDNTVQSLTGRGAHYLFRAPDGLHIRSGTDLLGDGVDVKAEGGYIIAPPSLHHTGRRYEWETGHHPDKTTVALPPRCAARAHFSRPRKFQWHEWKEAESQGGRDHQGRRAQRDLVQTRPETAVKRIGSRGYPQSGAGGEPSEMPAAITGSRSRSDHSPRDKAGRPPGF
jgi:hypothetical protein